MTENEIEASYLSSKLDLNQLESMERLFDRLFPICRSITGPGLRETLSILNEYIPLEIYSVPTGEKVYDWEIPKEWRIHGARLTAPNGEVIADFDRHNLHVLNYSVPVDQTIELGQLQEHLHSLPQLPEAIPYVTSYYKERWGFCIPHEVRERLQPGMYHAKIDSELVEGELNYGHAILPGESTEEILISTYVCHPSMANNELSGPLSAAGLYQRLKKWNKRRFTYRFVFVPETIGSIAYLYRFGQELKKNVYSGMVVTCVGGSESLSFKHSRLGDAPIDLLITHLAARKGLELRERQFTPNYGSDERQYGSPGFNLPVGQISRKLDGGYKEYHTSLDNKENMPLETLLDTIDQLEKVVQALEWDGYYVNQSPYGEVKLDRHGLYPDMNSHHTRSNSNNEVIDSRQQLHRTLTVLNYCDGEHRLLEIADICRCSILELMPVVDLLLSKGLLKGPYSNKRGLE